MTTATHEPPVFAAELKSLLGFTHSDTLRVKIKEGKVPPPDVKISQKTRFWHRSTLRRFGLLPEVNYPTTPAVDVEFPKPSKRATQAPNDDQTQAWRSDADKVGLRWIKKTRPKYCLYTFVDCGHSQEIGYKDVRSGSLKCRTCLADRYAKQAQAVGLTLIKQVKARVGLFKFNECGHVREIEHKSVRLNTFVCQECEGSWATRPSNLYVNLITLQGEQLVKVGHAKDVERRVKEYGLPSDAKLETVFVRSFPTGKDASTAETAILQKFKASRINEISHIMQKSGRTECLQPSVLHDVLVFAQSIPNQYFQESLP